MAELFLDLLLLLRNRHTAQSEPPACWIQSRNGLYHSEPLCGCRTWWVFFDPDLLSSLAIFISSANNTPSPLFSSGAWIHLASGSEELPHINVVSADPASDSYFRPTIISQFPARSYRFVDETIFVYGSDPTNRRTWTMNNLLPLHR